MPRKKTTDYDNTSITTLKGADRVRKRPAVIFGSDGIDGCQHSVFEILSNSIDEAREGYGKKITVTRYSDGSIEVEDHGRGIPVDYNENEKRYNWELVFCELYAGGKYNNNEGESYEFSLGMNGLGLCSTQYSSEYMDVDIRRDGYRYTLRFEKGEIVGKLKKEPYSKKDTGTKIHWKPDLEVFTDIDIQPEYFLDIMKRQAIVNAGIEFVFRNQNGKSFEPGNFVDQEGHVLGQHKGIICYTIGQRKGLGLALHEPMYVCRIDPKTNTVVLGRDRDLWSKELTAKDFHWISGEVPTGTQRIKAKIRYRHQEQWANAEITGPDSIHLVFDEPQRAITCGQSVVLYDGDVVVGGGTINGLCGSGSGMESGV